MLDEENLLTWVDKLSILYVLNSLCVVSRSFDVRYVGKRCVNNPAGSLRRDYLF
jgi:hypothetical protein